MNTNIIEIIEAPIFPNTNGQGKIAQLEHRVRVLERENNLLRALLAIAVGGRTVVYRENDVETTMDKKPSFSVSENMNGDILLSVQKIFWND